MTFKEKVRCSERAGKRSPSFPQMLPGKVKILGKGPAGIKTRGE